MTSFADNYRTKDTWVSGSPTDIPFVLLVERMPLPMLLHRARVSVNHADGKEGVIGAVLYPGEFVAAARLVADKLAPSLCKDSVFSVIAEQIEGAADILQDETQDPGQGCDAISIGLGFEAGPATLGGPLDRPAEEDPCSAP